MTEFISSFKKSFANASSSLSILPTTDYRHHVPKNAEQLMRNNWNKTGDSLRKAINKVGEDLEK